MKVMRQLLLLLFCFVSFLASAQTPTNDQNLEQKIENLAGASDQELDYSTLLDQLSYFTDHPLNLNTANQEELEKLLLLNDLQITAIINHRLKYGSLLTLQELQTIDGFDVETIYSILPYVTLGQGANETKITAARIFKEGKNQLFIREQRFLETSRGLSEPTATDSNRYAGSADKIYLRYRYTFSNRISVGLIAEKDAGEQFFKGFQKNGFDYYSGHFFYRSQKFIKVLALGDYQVQYGQGLTLWSGLAFGKSADVINVKRNARGLLPYSSVDENRFLRGGAISFGTKKLTADFFFSKHGFDANVDSSSIATDDELVISSLDETGFHRTANEVADKHAIQITHAGTHLQYRDRKLNIGATASYMSLEKSLERNLSLYNQFEFNEKTNFNAGLDYNYTLNNFNFFGETSVSENGGLATINGALIGLDPRISMSAIHRHYEKEYQGNIINAFGENTSNANENGFYLGISLKPIRTIAINAYADYFKFPWLRYQVDAPGNGSEYLAQFTYTPSKSFETYFRYKQRIKPDNDNNNSDAVITQVVNGTQQNFRWNVKYKISPSFWLANRVEWVRYQKDGYNASQGVLLFQDITYKPLKSSFTFNARIAFFDTDDYDARIYTYENDVLYAYSIPAFSGRGQRYYLNIRYKIVRGIDLWLRYASTVYTDLKTIGSGLDEIQGNIKSEIKAQVRFEF